MNATTALETPLGPVEDNPRSIAAFERLLVANARIVLKNPKLTTRDILVWSLTPIKARKGEIVFHIAGPDPERPQFRGTYVQVLKVVDKRQA